MPGSAWIRPSALSVRMTFWPVDCPDCQWLAGGVSGLEHLAKLGGTPVCHTRRLTNVDYNRGLCQTIDCDDVAELAQELRRQAGLAVTPPNGEGQCPAAWDTSY